jgi:hypothetical protein
LKLGKHIRQRVVPPEQLRVEAVDLRPCGGGQHLPPDNHESGIRALDARFRKGESLDQGKRVDLDDRRCGGWAESPTVTGCENERHYGQHDHAGSDHADEQWSTRGVPSSAAEPGWIADAEREFAVEHLLDSGAETV